MERINAVMFNPEANILITGCYDRVLRFWDMRAPAREPLQAMRGFGDSVTSIALPSFASGAACDEVVTGCVDGLVRTYDVRRGLMLADVFAAPGTCVSHRETKSASGRVPNTSVGCLPAHLLVLL